MSQLAPAGLFEQSNLQWQLGSGSPMDYLKGFRGSNGRGSTVS